jgi:predicted nucleic acid-binding protein
MKAVFDSSILRDYLMGNAQAQKEMARYREAAISVLAIQELLEAPEAKQNPEMLTAFLKSFEALPVDAAATHEAVKLRSMYAVGVPYALVWASARCANLLLVAHSGSPFATINEPGIRIAY